MTADDAQFGDIGTSLLLDNDQVRIWELRLEPGESSDLHHHGQDYVMVQIEGDKIAAQFEPETEGTFAGAGYLEGEVHPGLAIFARAGGRETAVNVGDRVFREVIVEVKSESRPDILPVHHIALTVNDIAASMPFYTDALGLEEIPRPDFGIPGKWLAAGNGTQVHLIENADFTSDNGSHLAFRAADLDAEIARLRSLDVEVSEPFELFGLRQAFFHDPSGNQFEVNAPA